MSKLLPKIAKIIGERDKIPDYISFARAIPADFIQIGPSIFVQSPSVDDVFEVPTIYGDYQGFYYITFNSFERKK